MEHGEASNQILMTLPNGYWSGDGAPAHEKPGHSWLLEGRVSGIGFELIPEEKNRERWYYKSYTTFTGTR